MSSNAGDEVWDSVSFSMRGNRIEISDCNGDGVALSIAQAFSLMVWLARSLENYGNYRLVPFEPTATQEACGFECGEFSQLMDEFWPEGAEWPYDCRGAAQFVRGIYQAMIGAAPVVE